MKPIDGKYPFGPYGVFPAFEITLSDEQVLCIGRIAVVQGQIEYFLGQLFAELSKIDGKDIPIDSKATLGRLVKELGRHALAGLAPRLVGKVRKLHDELVPIAARRNEILKSLYGYQYDGMGKGLMLQTRSLNGMGSGMLYLGDCPGNVGKEISVAAYRNDADNTRNGVDDLGDVLTKFILCSQGAGYIVGQLQFPEGFSFWDTWPFD